MNKKLQIFIFIMILGFLFGLGIEAQAYGFNDINKFYTSTGQTAGFNTAAGRFTLVSSMITALLSLAGAIFIALIVYGGFLWMTSRGAEDKIKKGKEVITYSIIGIVIIAGAYAITSLVAGAAFGGTGTENGTSGPTTPTCSGLGGVCLTAYQCASKNGTYNGAPDAPIPLNCNTEVCCLGLPTQ
jgi:hypothetical protein